MKILVCCPGSWRHGLDSPERGEGRWAQNLARLLGKLGHDVYACSMGAPIWGEGIVAQNVRLIQEHEAKQFQPFDIYIDTAWWNEKVPSATAKKNFHVHWSLEQHLRTVNFPKDHYIIYPYYSSKEYFIGDFNPINDRTFFLPVPLCETFAEPSFDKKSLLCPTSGNSWDHAPYELFSIFSRVLKEILKENPGLSTDWLFSDALVPPISKRNLISELDNRAGKDRFHRTLPYHKVMSIISSCKLAVPLRIQGCLLDSTALGVPTIVWEECCWFPRIKQIAENNGVLIEKGNETCDRLKHIVSLLLTDKELYIKYVKELQGELGHHTEAGTAACFNHILEQIF